jgi:NAD(P)-dependent dehydrogenase (short-subunit alcohol dehydrogenase family)
MNQNYAKKVALVTGATRGVGKGIAIGLGEIGATVYITGRTFEPSNSLTGSLKETQIEVEKAGGICIPVQVDHSNDEEIYQLFAKINHEQNGQLDILVNNVYSGVEALTEAYGKPFWESEPNFWDTSNHVGLRSHYIASVYAARMMTKSKQGLICTISSYGGMSYIFSVPYGVGKAACDRLAADMAMELKQYNVTSISLWPGIVGTELLSRFAAKQRENSPNSTLGNDGYNWETPLFTGRVIAAIASETNPIKRTGKVGIVAEIAKQYNLVDENGNCPASLRSLKFILPMLLPALKKYAWLIPDLKIPWFILLFTILRSPKI